MTSTIVTSRRVISRRTGAYTENLKSFFGARDSGDGQQDGVALAATAAQRRRTETATAAAQLEHERQRHPVARHADGVAQGDGTAVHVHDVVRDSEVGHRGQADGCERLVELEEVDVGDLLARLVERGLDGP